MERAKPNPVLPPGFFQGDAFADDADDVRLLLDELGEVGGHELLNRTHRLSHQNRSGILENAIRVGAAAPASNMLAKHSVWVPYL